MRRLPCEGHTGIGYVDGDCSLPASCRNDPSKKDRPRFFMFCRVHFPAFPREAMKASVRSLRNESPDPRSLKKRDVRHRQFRCFRFGKSAAAGEDLTHSPSAYGMRRPQALSRSRSFSPHREGVVEETRFSWSCPTKDNIAPVDAQGDFCPEAARFDRFRMA